MVWQVPQRQKYITSFAKKLPMKNFMKLEDVVKWEREINWLSAKMY